MARSKPNYEKVWASSGSKIDPDIATPGKIEAGWGSEIPIAENENFTQNKQDQFCAHINDFGIVEWDDVTNYANKAIVRSASDGEKYLSVQAVPAGNGDPSLDTNNTYWILINFGSLTQNGVVLTDVDMTNGGANNLNNIDVTWQSAWDSYDYVKIVIKGAESSNSGQMAFAISSDSGSTWKALEGSTNEALGWSDTSFGAGQPFDGSVKIPLNNNSKTIYRDMFMADTTGLIGGQQNFSLMGVNFNYDGTTLSNAGEGSNYAHWNTGSPGLSGYLLRFTHEVGNFTSGTFKIIGYNFP